MHPLHKEDLQMTYAEYLNQANGCTTVAAAESLINQAAEDYTLSARQYCYIRHIAIKNAYMN